MYGSDAGQPVPSLYTKGLSPLCDNIIIYIYMFNIYVYINVCMCACVHGGIPCVSLGTVGWDRQVGKEYGLWEWVSLPCEPIGTVERDRQVGKECAVWDRSVGIRCGYSGMGQTGGISVSVCGNPRCIHQ